MGGDPHSSFALISALAGSGGIFGYDLTIRSSASTGFAIVPSFPTTGGTLIEKRLFEQYLWSGHGQNRVFGGISRTVNAKVRFEAGYLNHYQHSLAGPNRLNHILSGTTALSF